MATELRVTLHGDPVSTNSLYRHSTFRGMHRTYMTKEGTARKQEYQWQYKGIVKKVKWPLDANYAVEVILYFKNKRPHDIDNFNKILLDAATGFVWNDDKQIQKLTVTKAIDTEFPRAEVTIHIL